MLCWRRLERCPRIGHTIMTTDEMLEVAGALERVAAKVRSFMPQFVDLQPDGSGAPQMLAMRDAFLAFPAPAEVLFIDGKGMAERRDCGPHWTLIRFDLSQPGTSQVNFATALKWEELPDHREMFQENASVLMKTLGSLSAIFDWWQSRMTKPRVPRSLRHPHRPRGVRSQTGTSHRV